MGSEGDGRPPRAQEAARRKHRSPPEEDEGAAAAAAEGEGSKRRKHHHHKHHRHSGRHHSRHHRSSRSDKHGREEVGGDLRGAEELENEVPPSSPGAESSGGLALLRRPPLLPETTVTTAVDLDDREEGEILEDEGAGDATGGNGEVLSIRGDNKAFEAAELLPDYASVDRRLVGIQEQSDRLAGESSKKMTPEGASVELLDAVVDSSNSGLTKKKDLKNFAVEHDSLTCSDEEYRRRTGYQTNDLQSGLHLEENGYKVLGAKDLERETKSRSPVSGESLSSVKEKKRGRDGTTISDRKLDSHRLRKHSEFRGFHRDEDRRKSVSPEILKEKYEASGHSPSYGRHHDDVYRREHSRPGEHAREMSHDRTGRSGVDYTDHAHSDMRDTMRADPDRERGSRRNRLENHDTIDRIKGIERDRRVGRDNERAGSRSRRDGQEDKYGTFDKGRDRERDRGMGTDRDREKSRDTTREKERERYSEKEKSRETERERERDREKARIRNSSRERERNGVAKDRDSGRDRDKDLDIRRDRDRDEARQMERDRARSRERHGDSRHSRYDDRERHRGITRSKESMKEPSYKKLNAQVEEPAKREEHEEDYEEKIEQQLANQEEEDPEKIIEESRRRRLAILEKHKQKQQQQQQQQEQPKEPLFEDLGKEEKTLLAEGSEPPTKDTISLVNVDGGTFPEVSEDRHAKAEVSTSGQSFAVEKSPQQNGAPCQEIVSAAGGLGVGTPKSEHSDDMFCDDIFGESPAGVRRLGKGDELKIVRSGLHDNWDDAEGYYVYRFGEVLDGRYEVIASHGKGVFSTVVRAKDLKAGKDDPEEVAIKIIRNNETMYKAGMGELTILKKLAGADPDDKRHCVRFLSSFKYRNHLCLVFESLHMNLREVLKKFGRNIGLKLTAVRAYAKQLFIALKHLRNCGVLHCDIKPDNMLVNEAKNVLKLCDFGNAMFAGKNEITPYLVSRFYRAPEIILGLPYDHPMDIWSVGCCLYEIYSGKVLFPGPTNNDMLRLHMELKGPFPKKMLRKGAFADQHFDQDLNFHATEEDPVTKKAVKRLLLNIKPKDLGMLLTTFPGEDPKMLSHFKDLLERIFILDPEKRMTVAQALSHPFITGK